MSGPVQFGSGTDSVQLSGTSVLTGAVDFGGGADSLALSGTSAFHGTLANSSGTAVNVGAGSMFDVTATGATNLASLTTGAGSTLGVSIGGGAATMFNVSGAADFGAGTNVKLNLLTLGGVSGTYQIVQAGTVTGADNLAVSSLPFLYSANVLSSTPGQVSLDVQLKSGDQLGLNRSEASALNAVVAAADSDAPIAQVFLGAPDSATLRASLQQMLPDYAGGAFENATKGPRLTSEILADPYAPVLEQPGMGLWLQQVGWGTSKSIGDTSSYKLSAWGAAAGLERNLGIGSIGLMGAYYASNNNSRHHDTLTGTEFQGGLYWRANFGHLHTFALGSIGHVKYDGKRYFEGTVNGTAITREADGNWSGTLTSATGGVSYEARMGRLSVRPNALIEYYRLKENGYDETGGGSAFDLSVGGRTSNETAASANLSLGYDFLATNTHDPWLRLELEGGRRQILSGTLGSTVAHFAGGSDFTLTPDARTNGWRGAIRLAGGGTGIGVSGEVNAEEQQGHASIGARAGIQLSF
ncbi:MAG: autotransporter outer membrane beta-barrel domain-containing protein [Sphingomonas sp.]|nr:autotransporter outer membrane beta-barrel domain-containing protein [Sphingomonas sp.]